MKSDLPNRWAASVAGVRGMFNLNDPRWGRGDGPSSADNDKPEQPPAEPPAPPPSGDRQPNNPRGRNAGPPDLDELWRDFNRKLGGMFGGSGSRRGRSNGGRGGSGGPGGGVERDVVLHGAEVRQPEGRHLRALPVLLEPPAGVLPHWKVEEEQPGNPALAGDQFCHHCPVFAYRFSVAAIMGRHHASLARYHSMVAARPERKSSNCGFHPSSLRSIDASIAYRRSCPALSVTWS